MKNYKFKLVLLAMLSTLVISCKESAGEKLENRLENKSDDLEERSDDLEDAADYIEDAVDDMEDAIENFKEALEEVENEEDRAKIRQRIIEILDVNDLKFKKDEILE